MFYIGTDWRCARSRCKISVTSVRTWWCGADDGWIFAESFGSTERREIVVDRQRLSPLQSSCRFNTRLWWGSFVFNSTLETDEMSGENCFCRGIPAIIQPKCPRPGRDEALEIAMWSWCLFVSRISVCIAGSAASCIVDSFQRVAILDGSQTQTGQRDVAIHFRLWDVTDPKWRLCQNFLLLLVCKIFCEIQMSMGAEVSEYQNTSGILSRRITRDSYVGQIIWIWFTLFGIFSCYVLISCLCCCVGAIQGSMLTSYVQEDRKLRQKVERKMKRNVGGESGKQEKGRLLESATNSEESSWNGLINKDGISHAMCSVLVF